MAVIQAFNAGGLLVQIDNPNIPHEQFNVGLPTVDQGYAIGVDGAAVRQSQQPITLATREISVYRVPTYEADIYHRIWLIPPTVNFGYVPSATSREVVLWNAHRIPRDLDSIEGADDEGLELSPDDAPSTYLPDEYRTYTIAASPDGPPVIEASYTFTFESGGEIRVLLVVGTRVVGWTFEPNWLEPVIERPAWLTDVQVKRDGSEQRRQLRGGPRVDWEFTIDASGDRRRLLENLLQHSGGRIFALPVWPDLRILADAAVIGATSLAIDAAGADYRVGGNGVLLGPTGDFEAFEIEAIEAESISLVAPLEKAWPAGTRVFPTYAAYMLEGRGFGRATREYVRGLARFRTVDEVLADELEETTLYRGAPVMIDEPNWRDAPEIDYARNEGTVDFEVGRWFRFDHAEISLPELRVLWSALDREAAVYLHAFLWARRGRQRHLWVPTWANDLRVVNYDDDGAVLDVAYCGLVDFGAAEVHRRDVRIELVDGTVLYRRITQVQTQIEGQVERATLDSALGQELEPGDFARISWLMLLRLDQDAVELTWHNPSVVETVLTFKGPRNDV